MTRDLTPDLARIIEARDFVALHEMLKHWSPAAAAGLLEALSVDQQVVAFRVLPRELAADVFEYLPLEAQERLLRAMAREDVAGILNEMAPDDRTALLDELPATVTRQLLNLLTPAERAVAVTLLGYPDGSIGRLMTPDYVRVRPDWTMDHVLDHIRRYGHDSETLSIVYVIDEPGRLIGEIPIRKVLLLPPGRARLRRDGPPGGGLEGHRPPGGRGPGLPAGGPRRPAGHGLGGHADRHRHHRRRAGRRRVGRHPDPPALRRRGGAGRALSRDALRVHGPAPGRLAGRAVPRRDAHRHRHGLLREGDRAGGRPGAVRAADHLERRQLGLAGGDPGDPGAGARRGDARPVVASHAPGTRVGARAGIDSRRHRLRAHRALVGVLGPLRAALAAGRADRGDRPGRDRALGDARRLDAALRAEAPGVRSRRLVGPVRGDAGGRDRAR